MSEIDMNQMIDRMRTMANQAGAAPANANAADAPGGDDFAAMLQSAVDKVNNMQMEAGRKAEAFELGDPNVELAEVMIALQKANVSFEAVKQVRNRLVSAYQEIMNMPI